MAGDLGARNLVRLLVGVCSTLGVFYSFLAFRALTWSPTFFIANARYERPLAKPAALELEEAVKSKFARSPGVQHGRDLFQHMGCVLCHGVGGQKGFLNRNYTKDRAPQLSTLAEKLLLYEREDVAAVLPALADGKSLDAVGGLNLPSPARVVAKYADTRKVILDGNRSGKKDRNGVQPIDMPSWKEHLTERDVNQIIAYLLTLYRWEGG